MRPLAVVEIAANARGEVPTAMLERLYRVSVTGVVILVLTEIGYEVVDEALDDIVADMPRDIPGVRYVERADGRAIASACRRAPMIFWKTEDFYEEAAASADADRIFPIAEMAVSTRYRAIRAMTAQIGRQTRECGLYREKGAESRATRASSDVHGTIN